MTDDQHESLRRHILDLKAEVQELKLMLKKQNEIANERFALLYEWCAPAEYKADVETDVSSPGETLDEFLNRIRT